MFRKGEQGAGARCLKIKGYFSGIVASKENVTEQVSIA
jgi:cytoskeletal protein CcmA (bactofilin family)